MTGTIKRRTQRIRFRQRVAEAQNWRCCYCGCRIEPGTATLDHVIPKTKGGGSEYGNCVAACLPCNNAKGDMWPKRFLQSLRASA